MAFRIARFGLLTAVALAVVAAAFAIVPTASAVQDVIVDDDPLFNEPRVMDGRVYAIDSHGDDVIVGGTFTTIRNAPTDAPQLPQAYLFKFNVATGQIDTTFNPQVEGESADLAVEGVAFSDDGAWVYIGGEFDTVNGVSRQNLAKLSTVDGSVDPTFIADASQHGEGPRLDERCPRSWRPFPHGSTTSRAAATRRRRSDDRCRSVLAQSAGH